MQGRISKGRSETRMSEHGLPGVKSASGFRKVDVTVEFLVDALNFRYFDRWSQNDDSPVEVLDIEVDKKEGVVSFFLREGRSDG
jgi:hypothetical protein